MCEQISCHLDKERAGHEVTAMGTLQYLSAKVNKCLISCLKFAVEY